MSPTKIINQIKHYSIKEKLLLVEEILRNIREEDVIEKEETNNTEPAILSMAGIMTDEEAKVFDSAIEECRQVKK